MARQDFYNLRDDYNRQSFDYSRRRFSSPAGRLYNNVHRRTVADMLGQLGITAQSPVLEVGPGPGRLTDIVADITDGPCVCLEQSDRMIELLSEIKGSGNILPVQGNAFSLPFGDGVFSLTCAFRFIHLFNHWDQNYVLREFFRVTKPGGYVMVEFNNLDYGVFLERFRTRNFLPHDMETYETVKRLCRKSLPGKLIQLRGIGFPLRMGGLAKVCPGPAEGLYLALGNFSGTLRFAQQLVAVWRKQA